jgi:DNA-binding response OmpR family regulator
VALLLEDFLTEFGCVPVGPCSTVAKGLRAVGTETFDLAVLDVNLDDEAVYALRSCARRNENPVYVRVW